jgi:hypothetical protein
VAWCAESGSSGPRQVLRAPGRASPEWCCFWSVGVSRGTAGVSLPGLPLGQRVVVLEELDRIPHLSTSGPAPPCLWTAIPETARLARTGFGRALLRLLMKRRCEQANQGLTVRTVDGLRKR